MSIRNPRAKWALPDVVNPRDRLCLKIEVPMERMHIAAFRGAIWNLCSAINWQDDPDHTAKEVANVWRTVYDNIKFCDNVPESNGIEVEDNEMNLRVKPDDPCIIQIRCGEDDWQDWYDPRICIADGVVTNPSPDGSLEAGECKEFTATLRGNDKWILPIPVSAGYVVTISDTSGGWAFDGVNWRCPDGRVYALGTCSGAPAAAGAGYPLPTARIGRLIVGIDEAFYDAYNTTFSVPVGVTSSDMIFQMNDDELVDNTGSVSFKVKVCRAASEWCHTFNFAVSDGGFHAVDVAVGVSANWSAGVGWAYSDFQNPAGNYYRAVSIAKEFVEAALTMIRVKYNLSGKQAYSDPTGGSDVEVNGVSYYGVTLQDLEEGTGIVVEVPVSVPDATSIFAEFNSSGDFPSAEYHGSIVITSIEICGTGANPFA